MRSHPDYYVEDTEVEVDLVCGHCDHEFQDCVEITHDTNPDLIRRHPPIVRDTVICPRCRHPQPQDWVTEQATDPYC